MARIRIVNAGAFCLIVLALAPAGAAAQTATAGSTGQPLPLLQIARQKSGAKLHAHHHIAATRSRKREVARRVWRKRTLATARHHHHDRLAKHAVAARHHVMMRHDIVEAQRAPSPPVAAATPAAAATPVSMSANAWPVANGGAAGEFNAFAPAAPPQSGPTIKTETVVDTDPNQLVPNGQAVQPVGPDLASPASALAPQAAISTPSPKVVPARKSVIAATTMPSHPAPTPAVRAMVAKQSAGPSPVGSTSWIMHILAALGGAVAAGVIAWFLMRPAPERRYG
jgi:hypothetical protein